MSVTRKRCVAINDDRGVIAPKRSKIGWRTKNRAGPLVIVIADFCNKICQSRHFENAMGASAQMHAMADLSPSVLQRLSIIHQA